MIKNILFGTGCLVALSAGTAQAEEGHHAGVPDSVIAAQNAALQASASGSGFGPQSPRDLTKREGSNTRAFAAAPARQSLNICNIHLHENAEHRGGEFTTFAGNGDGHGNGTGYKYNGTLTAAELSPIAQPVGHSEHGSLEPGDTIEIHFVYSSADTKPGSTLSACFNDAIKNPQLRVEAVIAVLVNNPAAQNMTHIAEIRQIDGLYQAPNLPEKLGTPVSYAGSTTGPSYNEIASPFQVTWNVRPAVAKLDINSLAAWFAENPFKEEHAHGARNLVTDPAMLSAIK